MCVTNSSSGLNRFSLYQLPLRLSLLFLLAVSGAASVYHPPCSPPPRPSILRLFLVPLSSSRLTLVLLRLYFTTSIVHYTSTHLFSRFHPTYMVTFKLLSHFDLPSSFALSLCARQPLHYHKMPQSATRAQERGGWGLLTSYRKIGRINGTKSQTIRLGKV